MRGTGFVLRPFGADDFAAALAFAGDPTTAGSVPPLPATDPNGVVESFARFRSDGELLHLVIADLRNNAYLGEVMLAVTDHGVGELGVGVAAVARNKGIATDAFCTFADWVAMALDLGRMQVLVAPENRAALRIAERAGFSREGLLRSYWEHDGQCLDAVMLSRLPGNPRAGAPDSLTDPSRRSAI